MLAPWSGRRRLIFAVVAFCMWTVAYALWRDRDSTVAETAVTFAFLTLGSTVGSYVFGKAWESIGRTKRKTPDADK